MLGLDMVLLAVLRGLLREFSHVYVYMYVCVFLVLSVLKNGTGTLISRVVLSRDKNDYALELSRRLKKVFDAWRLVQHEHIYSSFLKDHIRYQSSKYENNIYWTMTVRSRFCSTKYMFLAFLQTQVNIFLLFSSPMLHVFVLYRRGCCGMAASMWVMY